MQNFYFINNKYIKYKKKIILNDKYFFKISEVNFTNFKNIYYFNFFHFFTFTTLRIYYIKINKILNILNLKYLWYVLLNNSKSSFKFFQENNYLKNTNYLNEIKQLYFNPNKYDYGKGYFKLGFKTLFGYNPILQNNELEQRNLYVSINSLFIKNSIYWSNFIFNKPNIIENINYFWVYTNELLLARFLINPISKLKWKNYYSLAYFNNNLFEYKNTNIKLFNTINKNFLNAQIQEILFLTYLKLQIRGINWLIQNIFIIFFKKIFNKNIFININKYEISLKNTDLTVRIINNRFFSPYKSKDLNLELLNLILLMIKYKEPKLLIEWISYNMAFLFYRKHNQLITYIGNTLNFLFKQFGEKYNFFGYKLIFKGKINKIGSVRKRKIIYTKGVTSLSNVYYKINSYSKPILTLTGTIGCKIIINYL